MIRVLVSSEGKYLVDEKGIVSAVEEQIKSEGITNAEASVLIVGVRKMTELSKKYLHENKLHEVLSFVFSEESTFSSPDGVLYLGDIVVCFPMAKRLAKEEKKSTDEKILFLVRHGCSHLLGKHH